jgi:hypothetical protein
MLKKVAICGSMRVAKKEIEQQELRIMLNGDIPLPPCCMSIDLEREYGNLHEWKKLADQVHKAKIFISDCVVICNPGGYIGESTKSELEYAKSLDKPIVFTEPKLAPQ